MFFISWLVLAFSLTMAGDYEASEKLAPLIVVTPSNSNEYYYMRGVNSYALNKKSEAIKYLNKFEDSFEPKPRRYESMCYLMLQDMETWKDGDADEIVRDMNLVKDRLKIAKADEQTKKVQKDIVDKLSKLIEEAESKANPKDGSGQPKDGKGKLIPKDGQGTKPADDSKIMGGIGKGVVDEKKIKQITESWGGLPPAERAKVVEELTRDLPPKYKPMIDQYFKSLNKIRE